MPSAMSVIVKMRPGSALPAVALDAHAHLDALAEVVQRHQQDQLGVVVAERLLRLELQRDVRAGFLARQRLLDPRKDVVVPVQVDERLLGLFEQVALRVVHRDVEADERAVIDLHRILPA